MKMHLRDSDERRHYPVRRLETIDTKIDTFYTGTFSAPFQKNQIPHKHSFLEIMFIDEGQGTIVVNGVEYFAKKNDIVLYFPNNMHKEYSEINHPMHAMFFGVKYTDSLKKMFEKCHPSYVFDSKQEAPLFLKLFKILIDESKGEELPYSDKITNCIVKTIVLKILQISINDKEEAKSNEFVKTMVDYLDQHYLEEISLDKYYKELPFSKYYISRLFKSCMGTTPVNYIITKRMEKARILLNETNMKIMDIANEVGYKDIYYFTKLFKKEIGVAPTSYRKRNL